MPYLGDDELEFDIRPLIHHYLVTLEEYRELRELGASPNKRRLLENDLERQRSFLYEQQHERWQKSAVILEKISKAETGLLKAQLRMCQRDLAQLPSNFTLPEYDQPLIEERRWCEEMIFAIEEVLEDRGVDSQSGRRSNPADRIADQISAKVKARIRLEQERDEALKNSPPHMHETIKERYGRELDNLLEDE